MKNKLLLVLGTALLGFGLSSCGNSKPTLVQVTCDNMVNGARISSWWWSDGSRDLWIDVDDTEQVCVILPEEESGAKRYHYDAPPAITP